MIVSDWAIEPAPDHFGRRHITTGRPNERAIVRCEFRLWRATRRSFGLVNQPQCWLTRSRQGQCRAQCWLAAIMILRMIDIGAPRQHVHAKVSSAIQERPFTQGGGDRSLCPKALFTRRNMTRRGQ